MATASKMPRMQDPRLSTDEPPKWRVGKSLGIKRFEYVVYEPLTRIDPDNFPSSVEFSLTSNRPWFFGPNTHFIVQGKFQVQNLKGTSPNQTKVWEDLGADNSLKDYTLCPNWFEYLIKSFKVYHDNAETKTSNESDYIRASRNQFLYSYMKDEAKAKLGKDLCHPVWSNYTNGHWGKWFTKPNTDIEADKSGELDEWRQVYGPSVINAKGDFRFAWIPPNEFPFWQGTNFPLDEFDSRPLPMQKMPKPMSVNIFFNRQDEVNYQIYKKSATAPNLRFVLTDIKLMVEEAETNPALDKAYWGRKGEEHKFRGLTTFVSTETIPSAVLTYRTRFQNIDFPEGIFIYAAHKNLVGGTFAYKELSSKSTWKEHNITEVGVSFNGKEFFNKEPHLGQIDNADMDYIRSLDYAHCPPFGYPLDPKHFTPAKIAKGSHGGVYPHVYINLKRPADKQRVVPVLDDGGAINTKGNLDIALKFNSTGAAANTTYYVYVFWTDTAQVMEFLPNGEVSFSNPYLYK